MKLTVARSVDKFNNTWTAPGVYVRTATDLTEEIDTTSGSIRTSLR